MTEKGNHYFVSAAYNRPLRKIIDFPFLCPEDFIHV